MNALKERGQKSLSLFKEETREFIKDERGLNLKAVAITVAAIIVIIFAAQFVADDGIIGVWIGEVWSGVWGWIETNVLGVTIP